MRQSHNLDKTGPLSRFEICKTLMNHIYLFIFFKEKYIGINIFSIMIALIIKGTWPCLVYNDIHRAPPVAEGAGDTHIYITVGSI